MFVQYETDPVELAYEAWVDAGKPSVDSPDFDAICYDYDIDHGDLQDVVNDSNESIAPEDIVESY